MAVTELWVVAQQNPGASDRMMFVKHATGPSGGWRFLACENEAGAVDVAEAWSDRLNQRRGIDNYLPVRVYLDGNQWCAVHRNFVNLQESHAGFGDTIEAAVRDLPIAA